MLIQNILAGAVVLSVGAIGNTFRRWARRIESRLGKIEKQLNLNGRDYAD